MIQISAEEFKALEKEVKELNKKIEILMDRELMEQVADSEKDIKKGRVRSWDEVKKELKI